VCRSQTSVSKRQCLRSANANEKWDRYKSTIIYIIIIGIYIAPWYIIPMR
jgi:hypothetical protein